MPDLLACAALSPAVSSVSSSSVSMRNSQSFDSSGALTRLQSCSTSCVSESVCVCVSV